MDNEPLAQAVEALAAIMSPLSDGDLAQPWTWGAHTEGLRFALIGTYHELRDLAVSLAVARATDGPRLTVAQAALAPYLEAYRELQAVMRGASDEAYDREPAPDEWPLRTTLGHIVVAHRNFFTLVHYGLRRQREGNVLPLALPDGEADRVTLPYDEFETIMEQQGQAEGAAFHQALFERTLREIEGATDEEMRGPSLYWEGEGFALSLHYRLHRMDAHLRQHTIQAEKTLELLGHHPTEASRLLRLVARALAAVEGATLGAPEPGAERRHALAATIRERAEKVAERMAHVRTMVRAAQEGDVETARRLVAAEPQVGNALNDEGLPVVLVALYNGHRAVAEALVDGGATLHIFEAAALGHLERVQAVAEKWPGWINEFSKDGFTPLQLACFFGQEATALWLIEQGANVNTVARHPFGLSAIHAASANGNLTVLRTLLERGAAVDARQEGGGTALHNAVGSGNLEMTLLLLAHGADLNAALDNKQTPLALAVAQGHEELAAWLRQRGAHE